MFNLDNLPLEITHNIAQQLPSDTIVSFSITFHNLPPIDSVNYIMWR